MEQCINRLKQWRGLATCYAKRAVNYWAMVGIAAIVIWLDPSIRQTISDITSLGLAEGHVQR